MSKEFSIKVSMKLIESLLGIEDYSYEPSVRDVESYYFDKGIGAEDASYLR